MDDEKIAFVVTAIFFLAMGYIIVSGDSGIGSQVPEKLQCDSDSDCVAGGECCHPSGCVNQEHAAEFQQENCEGVACTMMCAPCPECECVDGRCEKTGEQSVEEGGCC